MEKFDPSSKLTTIKGKDYLEVKWRVVWFRQERPNFGIETEVVSLNADSATVKVSIKDDKGMIMAMAHKTEDRQGFADFLEKAETGAIGRALALIGYGTQFTDEFDEKHRIVDAPVKRTAASAAVKAVPHVDNPGDTVLNHSVGDNTKGSKVKDMLIDDLELLLKYWSDSSRKQNLTESVISELRSVRQFLAERGKGNGKKD